MSQLADEVMMGKKQSQVLATNLIKEGLAGPLGEDQQVIRVIKTREGLRRVSNEVWEKAMIGLAGSLGSDLEGRGCVTSIIEKEGKLEQRVRLSIRSFEVEMFRIEEYDLTANAENPPLTSVGFEIARRDRQ